MLMNFHIRKVFCPLWNVYILFMLFDRFAVRVGMHLRYINVYRFWHVRNENHVFWVSAVQHVDTEVLRVGLLK